jgi:SAM-dependent methyltransferase
MRDGLARRIFAATEEENRRVLLSEARPRPRGVLLDLGCGDGALTVRLAERVGAGRMLGVERDAGRVALARARGVEVVVADLAETLPVADATVDVVVANQVIEHVPATDRLLAEVRRVLRPDGYALVSTNNLASWHVVAALVIGWQPAPCHVSEEVIVGTGAAPAEGDPGSPGQMHLRLFTHRALAGLAAFHGLAVDGRRTAGYYPFGPRVARVLARLDPGHGAYLVHRLVPASRR